MPTYDYKCLKCKKTFEQLQSIKAASLKKCIYCKGRVERLIGAGSGLIFKGTGFYITDYKNKPSPKASDGGSKKPADSDKTKSEAK